MRTESAWLPIALGNAIIGEVIAILATAGVEGIASYWR